MQDIPPKTAAIRMTGIKEYFLINDIELSAKDTRQIKSRMPKGGARTIERDLDNKVAQVILAHSDVKGKALILSLLSSGMRLGECLQLRFSDVDLEKTPAEITIRQEMTKTRHQRVAFLSREAVTALQEWLKVRQAYIDSAANRNAGLVASGVGSVRSKNDPRIFPFTSHVAQQMWRTTVKNAGLASVDESTGRHQYHYHQFRKFFRSQMALTCPIDIVEALLGHESYLASAYRRYTREQMAEYYLKSEHHITISLPSSEIGEFQTEIKMKMSDQQMSISTLVSQNRQLEQKLKTMGAIVDALTEGRI
jgi:integrase